jgi:hypothetical protein
MKLKINYNQPILHKTVHTMLFTLLFSALCYCAILFSLVFSVIERKQNTISSRDLASELSTLEMQYGSKVSAINDTTLIANNYVRVDGTTFAVRKDAIATYTLLYAR